MNRDAAALMGVINASLATFNGLFGPAAEPLP